MLAKVGTFSSPAATGNQTYDTALGADLDAIILMSSPHALAVDTFINSNYTVMYGVATGASNEWSMAAFSNDGLTTMDTASLLINDGCLVALGNTASIAFRANLDSFGTGADAGKFTLNWTVTAASGRPFYYLALSGVDAHADVFTLPTTGATHEVNGPAFTPTGLLVAYSHGVTVGTIAAHLSFGIGFADGTAAMNTQVTSEDNVGTSDTYRHQRTSNELTSNHVIATGAAEHAATLSTFDADGFTLSISDNPSGAIPHGYLALGGCQAKVVNETFRITTTGTKATTGVGFQPKAMLTSSADNTATTSVVAHNTLNLGLSDGTNDAGLFIADTDATVNAQCTARHSATYSLIAAGVPPADGSTTTLGATGQVNSFDSDGFTINYDLVGGAIEFITLLVGDAPAAPSTWIPRAMVI